MSLNFNKSLVLPWSDELSQKEPYEYPFLSSYVRKNKTLHYIATLHSTEEGSETFKLIEETIKKNSINIVIVEGIPNSRGISPDSFKNWANNQGKEGRYDGFETAFTIKTSVALNISFIGGEPEEIFIYDKLVSQNFKIEDYLFYTFIQQLFQAKEAKTLDTLSLESKFNNFIKQKISQLNINKNFTLNDFYDWYLSNNLASFNIDDIIPETCAPYSSGRLLTQKVSSAICILRDQFIVSVIEKSLNSYNNVLVVYGGSHWSTQRESLENTLGVPKFSQL
ncbi:hypothetical protein HBN50_14500 [Halobacteriovorax sp. GB3]|uniref:hypothetical protein n=1 Tax=Halobacteriovorax sp. GB3 TaxID=2719615 RepID=UPI00236233AF|nr:hypothetical protein [Halobacteriovorax sp. GB3]MDD0854319.1 hypothetical protein [Halobacteriovorax sp. GB3]